MQNPQPQGYLALPPAGDGPGVLVLHAWWGLNDTIKQLSDRLAAEGFTAYAPDLFHGRVAQTIPEAEALSQAADNAAVLADTVAAFNFLWERAGRRPLGVVGFSFGAFPALILSDDEPERLRAVVLFYGTGARGFERTQAAYQGHFAANDPYESPEEVDALEAELKSIGREVEFYRYPGVGHWFFEPDRPDAYNAPAARLAWERTEAFLREKLEP